MNRSSKLSIITVCLNSGRYIEKTITSIRDQKWAPLEYIVIDGGSTDGTLEILKSNSGVVTSLESEPDRGIAHAMNKGVAAAKGEYIIFLHADDYLPNPDIIMEVEGILTGGEVHIFDYCFETAMGKERRSFHQSDLWLNFKGVCHQSTICRRDLFSRHGGFDESFKICMDYDFFLRLKRAGVVFLYHPEKVLAVMRDTGVSSRTDWKSISARLSEERRLHMKNCPNRYYGLMYHLWWTFYPVYKKLRTKK